ncbi:MAG: hypothetical protein HGJ94_18605 [Desulfosarcina sp.]|nr:hypothetical protein [Desulfosarcina sp.]MBC2741889.1 hypothetical protein [Desulfosarcina sp.]MBC2764802.1 hypothetical protein [Desulfosarcina sp.]
MGSAFLGAAFFTGLAAGFALSGAAFLVGAFFFGFFSAAACFCARFFLEVDLIRLFFPMKNPFEFEFGLAYIKRSDNQFL